MTMNRLQLSLAYLCLALTLAACKATCRSGTKLVNGVCRQDGAATAADSGASTDGGDPRSENEGGVDAGARTSVGVAGANAGSGNAAAGAQASGEGGSPAPIAGSGNASTDPMASAPATETCAMVGATRCSMQGQNMRETCVSGAWVASDACAASEVCTDDAGAVVCRPVEELCKGSNGAPVCDGQGTMFLCNADGTVNTMEVCESARLCQAGLATSSCPICLAKEQFRCMEVSLEVCADDGKSFVKLQDCDNPGLCNETVGECTTAVCVPNEFSCQGNTLKKCNGDGSAFDEAATMDCGTSVCDADGADCNRCEPGQKICMGNAAAVCDMAGQMHVTMPCPNGQKCQGAGQCVDCTADTDCASLTRDCKVGACENFECVAKDARSGTSCMAGSRPGTCQSGGKCECTKQCSKPCGDGCGGDCPDTCGSMMCEYERDRCVQCLDDGDCRQLNSSNGCSVGMCNRSNGRCEESHRDGTDCSFMAGVTGQCSRGECTCASRCDSTHCNRDECGRTCEDSPCTGNQECNTSNNRCEMVAQELPVTPCGSISDCNAVTNENCSTYANYCTPPCGNNTCAGGRSCVDGFCHFRPSPNCPAGLSTIRVTAYVEGGPQEIEVCAIPEGA
jgi:hypothetical protein